MSPPEGGGIPDIDDLLIVQPEESPAVGGASQQQVCGADGGREGGRRGRAGGRASPTLTTCSLRSRPLKGRITTAGVWVRGGDGGGDGGGGEGQGMKPRMRSRRSVLWSAAAHQLCSHLPVCAQAGAEDEADAVQEEAERLSDHRLQRIGRELWEEEPSEPQSTATPAKSSSSPPGVTGASSPGGAASSPQQQGSPGSPEPASSTSGSALRPPPKLTAAAALALEIARAPWNMSASPRGGGAVQAVHASAGSVLGRGAAAGLRGEGESALLGRGGTAAGLRGDSGALSEASDSRGGEGARDEWVNIPGPMRVTGETHPAAPMDPGGVAAGAGSGEGTARRMTSGGGDNNGVISAMFDEKAAMEALSEQ